MVKVIREFARTPQARIRSPCAIQAVPCPLSPLVGGSSSGLAVPVPDPRHDHGALPSWQRQSSKCLTDGSSSPHRGASAHGQLAGLLLHGKRKLQRLLLAALDYLLPELTLVLHPLQLRLDVLLRDLEEAKHAVVCLLGNHVKYVSETLRAALAPGLVDTEGHVLSTLLPTKELDVGLALIDPLGIVEPGAREDADNLSKLNDALRQGGDTVLEILERLLVDLRVEHVVHRIHLCLPILLVHIPLLLHAAHRIAVLLDIDLVRSAFHRQTIDLLAEFQDVALVL